MTDLELLEEAGELGVRGRVGPFIIQYNARARRIVVYVYTYPTTPPSLSQVRVRNAMRQAMAEYVGFSDETKESLYIDGLDDGLSGSAEYAQHRIPQLV